MIDRFWSKVDCRSDDECWPWTAGTKDSRPGRDYGKFWIPARKGKVLAHRFAYAAAYGVVIPAGTHVLHRCDNPRCCNPAHLYLGTHADNMRDMSVRGRVKALRGNEWRKAHPKGTFSKSGGVRVWGSKSPRAILNEDQVREIRCALAGAPRGVCVRLASKYGVHPDTIRKIKQGRNWSHSCV
jgi:hypothetical protein